MSEEFSIPNGNEKTQEELKRIMGENFEVKHEVTLKEDIFNSLMRPLNLASLTTYCGELSRIIPKQSEHFTRTDSYYTAYGMEGIYHCNIDGRDYVVSIRPKKG